MTAPTAEALEQRAQPDAIDTAAAREWIERAVADGMIRRGSVKDIPLLRLLADHRALGRAEGVAAGVAAERERAAGVCEQQAVDFLSPEYATHQRLSSFSERFACAQCAAAIRQEPQP